MNHFALVVSCGLIIAHVIGQSKDIQQFLPGHFKQLSDFKISLKRCE